MLQNRMRELLNRDEPALGAWANLTDPASVEIMAVAGLDYAFVDTEHGGLGLEGVTNHLRAARAFGLGAMVRVYTPEEKFILRVLDCGAEGVLVPHCRGPEDARRAVAAVRYPPAGSRGYTMNSRGADYGAHGARSATDAAELLNRLLVVGIYIEDIGAVERIDEIVAVPGVDFCQIGPGDLSASMGHTGTANHPEVASAMHRVITACRAAGVHVGMTVGHASLSLTYEELRDAGCRALIVASDSGVLLEGFQSRVDRVRRPVA